ncbi:hypothetical protein LUR56_39680 [Streptomyces sp. MT29]|nr:hypothetical protein [Streptomyces sp. MT29]
MLVEGFGGVFQARVLRGRLLRVKAAAWSSSMPQRDRSVPFGKYCRSRPFEASYYTELTKPQVIITI